MAIRLDSGFEILRFSDEAYEKLTVELQFDSEQIAQLNIDSGEPEIELFTQFVNSKFKPKFRLAELLAAIAAAEQLLIDSTETRPSVSSE